jgi:hypothetical protein
MTLLDRVPPPDEIRHRIYQLVQEADLLRALLRVAESISKRKPELESRCELTPSRS